MLLRSAPAVFFSMLLQSLESLIADDMLYAARIFFGSLHVDTEFHEKFTDDDMSLVYLFRDLGTFRCQGNVTLSVDLNEFTLLEDGHGSAYAGLRKA